MRMHLRFAFLAVSLSSQPVLACYPQESRKTAEETLVAKARAIHTRVLTLDTHKDIDGSGMLAVEPSDKSGAELDRFKRKFDPRVRGVNQVDFPKMREGGYDCAFFIVFVPQQALNPAGFHGAKKRATRLFDAIHRMVDKYPKRIGLARSADDVQAIHASGRLVACIGIENGYAMGNDIARLTHFHARGARYMGIAHTGHTQLGDAHTPAEPLHGGLSELGRKAVVEMNRLGIMVDVSHAAKSSMMQAVELSKAPVLASHSACRAICDHTRNLDDKQLRALAAKGGVIQVVALGAFVKDGKARRAKLFALAKEAKVRRWRDLAGADLTDAQKDRYRKIYKDHPKATVSHVVDHIDHAVKLIGIDHVAISSDFDGGGGVLGWNNAAETFNVTLELVRRGYSEEQISQLWSANTLRLLRKVEAVSKQLQGAAKNR